MKRNRVGFTGRVAHSPRPGFWQRLHTSFAKRRKLLQAWIGFDRDWYTQKYPEIAVARIDPFGHYVQFGTAQGRYKSAWHQYLHQQMRFLKAGQPLANPQLPTRAISQPKTATFVRGKRSRPSGKKSVLVYNSFWKTLGGGEKHALEVALRLPGVEAVHLVGEEDFDLKELLDRFGIRTRKKIVKLARKTVEPSVTGKVFAFLNSSYLSNLVPRCRNSFFIVNFPHPHPPKNFLSAYTFWCNSDFTAACTKAYWGDRDNFRILYPILGLKRPALPRWEKKEKLFLNIGRFNAEGHNKNQLEIIRAFTRAAVGGWRLHLLGGVETSFGPSQEYFERCLQAASAWGDIALRANVERREVDAELRRALFFVSATGLPNRPPEYQEHFGIAFFQGLLHGCIPIVYRGGQPELICARYGIGHLFETAEELATIFQKVAATPRDILIRESRRVQNIAVKILAQMQKENRKVLGLSSVPG